MKTDDYTEKLFCLALLKCGTDIAAKVLDEYIKIRDSKETDYDVLFRGIEQKELHR